jgi:hypothetical protein
MEETCGNCAHRIEIKSIHENLGYWCMKAKLLSSYSLYFSTSFKIKDLDKKLPFCKEWARAVTY